MFHSNAFQPMIKWNTLIWYPAILEEIENFESQAFRSGFQTRADSDELSLDQDWDSHNFEKTWSDALNDLKARV